MLNKYQKALDNFKGYKNICEHMKFDEDIATLQELVDNYPKYENVLDKASEKLYNFNMCKQISEFRISSIVYDKETWKEWLLNGIEDSPKPITRTERYRKRRENAAKEIF